MAVKLDYQLHQRRKKKYQKIDKKHLEEKNHDNNASNKTIEQSTELYILRKAKWVLLF